MIIMIFWGPMTADERLLAASYLLRHYFYCAMEYTQACVIMIIIIVIR